MLKLVLCLFAMFFILLMPLIPSENNLHMYPSSNSMVEITSCFYSDRILNHCHVLAHGLAFEMRLFTLTNCFSALSFPEFYYVFTYVFFFFFIFFYTRPSSPCLSIFEYVLRD